MADGRYGAPLVGVDGQQAEDEVDTVCAEVKLTTHPELERAQAVEQAAFELGWVLQQLVVVGRHPLVAEHLVAHGQLQDDASDTHTNKTWARRVRVRSRMSFSSFPAFSPLERHCKVVHMHVGSTYPMLQTSTAGPSYPVEEHSVIISGAKKPGLPQKSVSFLPRMKVADNPKSHTLTSKMLSF